MLTNKTCTMFFTSGIACGWIMSQEGQNSKALKKEVKKTSELNYETRAAIIKERRDEIVINKELKLHLNRW